MHGQKREKQSHTQTKHENENAMQNTTMGTEDANDRTMLKCCKNRKQTPRNRGREGERERDTWGLDAR